MLRMENFNILGFFPKDPNLKGGSWKANIEGRGADLRGDLAIKREVFLRGGWYPNVHYIKELYVKSQNEIYARHVLAISNTLTGDE